MTDNYLNNSLSNTGGVSKTFSSEANMYIEPGSSKGPRIIYPGEFGTTKIKKKKASDLSSADTEFSDEELDDEHGSDTDFSDDGGNDGFLPVDEETGNIGAQLRESTGSNPLKVARPRDTYLKEVEEGRRTSIFRPSSNFLDNAKNNVPDNGDDDEYWSDDNGPVTLDENDV